MFGVRGGDDGASGACDRATAMFLSMMDDVRLRSNFFCIGTTNRYDLVDPAVIRSGRLGLHLQIEVMDLDDKIDVLRLCLKHAHNEIYSDEEI
jgi:SpoVK/Ycf46/Vps4 family AAA+-type ATPase